MVFRPLAALLIATLAAMACAAEPVVSGVAVDGEITGETIRFTIAMTVVTAAAGQRVAIAAGDVALDRVEAADDGRLDHDAASRTYWLSWNRAGTHAVKAVFAARAVACDDGAGEQAGAWRTASLNIPSTPMRTLSVVCDRADLEVRFPGALRVQRDTVDGRLRVRAVLGADAPFTVAWKPQVERLAAELVVASDANLVVRAVPGALRIDALHRFEIAQGRLERLRFSVPAGLDIVQVRGEHLLDWRVVDEDEARILVVALNRPQTGSYTLQLQAELPLTALPQAVDLPVVEPLGMVRSGGAVVIGTDSALQLVVERSAGLSQVDAAAWPRVQFDAQQPRLPPTGKAFHYLFSAMPFSMRLALADVVPSVDADYGIVATVGDDDLVLACQIQLEVRDAALRQVELHLPSPFSLAGITGADIDEDGCTARPGEAGQILTVPFKRAVLGRTLIDLRLELGRSPLEGAPTLRGPHVVGARAERGWLALTAEAGLSVEPGAPDGLRPTHPGSLPARVTNAQAAWRLRGDWSLGVRALRKRAGVRADALHLLAIGDGVAYGTVVVNYVITGAPVDELRFTAAAGLRNLEFVGADIAQRSHDGERWTVKLKRKVTGDYNLGVTYRVDAAAGMEIGGVACADVETDTGYLVCASERNLQLVPREVPAGLLEIEREEIPANYRLLVSQPILRCWKYIAAPHRVMLDATAFPAQGVLPAVVEVAQARTELSVREDGVPESLTRVRYAVKNATGQFLSLELPAGARLWAASIIEADEGSGEERRERVTATVDGALLKLPLRRYPNPNQPTTLEIEYGQVHAGMGWSGRLELSAPRSPAVRTAFSGWTVAAPAGWTVLPGSGGTMVAERGDLAEVGLVSVLRRCAIAWIATADRLLGVWPVGLIALSILVVVGLTRRTALAAAGAIVVAVCGIGLAVVAGLALPHPPAHGQSAIAFSQLLDLGGAPAEVVAAVLPSWRSQAGLDALIVAPLLALALACAAWRWRRARLPLAALAIGAAAYALAATPAGVTLLAHLATWVLPVIAIVVLAARSLGNRIRAIAPAVTALLAAMLLLPGCGTDRTSAQVQPVIERLEAELTSEPDAVAATLRLHLRAGQPGEIALVPASAVLVSPSAAGAHLRVIQRRGQHVLVIDRAGDHRVELRFLLPLTHDPDQGGSFALAVPTALSARVSLSVARGGWTVAAPEAIGLEQREVEGRTLAQALLAPGAPAAFSWRPRARDTAHERPLVYADVATLARFDAGLVDAQHLVRLRIAQGEVRELVLRLPDGMTVAGVDGLGVAIATWRYDPAGNRLEVRLAAPATADLALVVSTRTTVQGASYRVVTGVPAVEGVEHQRSALALAATSSVAVEVVDAPPALDPLDFVREAQPVAGDAAKLGGAVIRSAYHPVAGAALTVSATEVEPELRVREQATFAIADDRLVYAGELHVDVAKAGVFGIELTLPDAYDIDALSAPEIAHWDELPGEPRRIAVHFRGRTQAVVVIKLGLSRSVEELPATLAVPRIAVSGAFKHAGHVVVTAERGVRVTLGAREGIGELDPAEIGVRAEGALAVRLLRPDWRLDLGIEALKPLITAEQLHQARVSEGLVRHALRLRLRLQDSGARAFDLALPDDALGVTVDGPEIASWRESQRDGQRVVRIELARKWFDRPYPLTLGWESRFDRAAGALVVRGVRVLGADLQRGHLVVHGNDRVELAGPVPGKALQEAQARLIPRELGGTDLADAAFCYAVSAGVYELALTATRHDAAALLDARVSGIAIDSVVTERGETLNRVRMRLVVGAKRNLKVTLPAGAELWSVSVDRRPTPPARADGALLIPLARSGAGEAAVDLEFVYAVPGDGRLAGGVALVGPRFDLPLRDVRWSLWLPEGFAYDSLGGTLDVDREALARGEIARYGLDEHTQTVRAMTEQDRDRALELQAKGHELARGGFQYEARQALESAQSYSAVDPALNEDARVQLHKLNRQQAVVGLVGRRDYLRRNAGASPSASLDLGDRFNDQDAERVAGNLSKDDSDNLDAITTRLFETQELAAGTATELTIAVPVRGRRIDFVRPLQVDPDAEMAVRLVAKPRAQQPARWPWALGVAAGALILLAGMQLAWRSLGRSTTVVPDPVAPSDPWKDLPGT